MVEELVPELAPQEAAIEPPRQILIVDDDEDQVCALEHRLRRLGYQTAAARSAREALATAFEDHPDLVLLDLRLPDGDGFNVCETLSDSPSTCGIPIIVVSAMERPDIVRQARSAGCEFYVRKPYDPNVLLTLIEHALQHHDSEDW